MDFSIIIPVYNVEKYIEQCIESILSQKYMNFELILVNDGSTDRSGEICEIYSKKDKRVITIHKKNGGQSEARNCGLNKSKGKYIIFIDSDDYIANDNFLLDIHEKTKNDHDIILFKFKKYYDDKNSFSNCSFSFKNALRKSNKGDILMSLVEDDAYYGSPWTKCIKKELLVSNNIEFQKGLLGEDMDWYFYVVIKAQTISLLDESYIIYRQRAGSTTATYKLKNLVDYIEIMEKWSSEIKNSFEIDDKTKEALLGALAKYYANLLIVYSRIRDANKIKYSKRIKELSNLLNYSASKRPKAIKKIYRIFKLRGTNIILIIIDKVRKIL